MPTLSPLCHHPGCLGRRWKRRPSGTSAAAPPNITAMPFPSWAPKGSGLPRAEPSLAVAPAPVGLGARKPHLSSGPSCMQSRLQAGRNLPAAGGWLSLPSGFPHLQDPASPCRQPTQPGWPWDLLTPSCQEARCLGCRRHRGEAGGAMAQHQRSRANGPMPYPRARQAPCP